MKHTNKKGFTIVELVIVIAVIAILAAVLIPTFSNLIKKANISNDTAIAKNLNTAAITAQADTFDQAVAAAQDAGYLVALLKAKAENCLFVWEDDTNQFLLYDLDAKKVLYSNTTVDGAPDESWNFVANNEDDKAAVKAVFADAVKVQLLINNDSITGDVLFENGSTVYVATDMTVGSFAPTTAGNYNVNMNGNKLTTSEEVGAWVEGANVVLSNGVIDSTTSSSDVSVFAGSQSVVELNNVQLQAQSNANPLQAYGGTLILNNVTTAQTGEADSAWYNSVIQIANLIQNDGSGWYFVEGGYSKVVVNGGVYSGKRAIQMSAPGGTVIINSGSFIGAEAVINADYNPTYASQGATYSIEINGGTFDGKIKINNVNISFVINGGTFSNTGLTLEVFKGYVAEGKTVVENDNGTWTVQ